MQSPNLFLVLSLAFATQSVFASEGGSTRGGGDIQCDNLIQNLAFQDPAGNLQSWIKNGGPEVGKLDLSSSLNPSTGKPYSYSEYDSAMLALLNIFASSPDVNCVRPGDKGYPVSVGDTSKICVTAVDQAGVHITCDRNLFMALTPDQQIEQTHHEFAINVPGLEKDAGSISTYKISDQLSAYISNVNERRLVVSSPQSSTGIPNLTDIAVDQEGNVIEMNQNDATQYCQNMGDRLPTIRELALWATQYGARISNTPQNGFEEIDGTDTAGNPDTFYYQHSASRIPIPFAAYWFWSSSVGSWPDDDLAYGLLGGNVGSGGNGYISYAFSIDSEPHYGIPAVRCVKLH